MRKKHNRCLKNVIFILTAIILMLFGGKNVVRAAETKSSSPVIMIEKYSVTDEKIIPGQEFTLTLELINHSGTQTADDIMLDIENPAGVAPVYGETSQVFVGSIGAGKTKEIQLQYQSWTSIEGESLDFKVTILSNQPSNYVVLRVPVGSDSPFDIITQTMPSEIMKGEEGTASVSFNVLADSKISNISLKIQEGTNEIATSNIGNVTAGSSKNQTVSFELNSTGEHTVEMILQYNDEKGMKQQITVGTWKVKVVNEYKQAVDESGTGQDESSQTHNGYILVMGVSGLLILIICLIVAVLLRKRR